MTGRCFCFSSPIPSFRPSFDLLPFIHMGSDGKESRDSQNPFGE